MSKHAPFPVVLKLEGRPCLVVGSGPEAEARARALLEAGARVRVVMAFEPSDLDGVWLVVLTDRDDEVAASLAAETERRQIFFCAVDQPAHGSFAHVARVQAGSLGVAITTAGKAPALARRLRELLQALFDEAGMAEYVARLARLREQTPSADRARVLGDAVRELRIEGRLVVPPRGE